MSFRVLTTILDQPAETHAQEWSKSHLLILNSAASSVISFHFSKISSPSSLPGTMTWLLARGVFTVDNSVGKLLNRIRYSVCYFTWVSKLTYLSQYCFKGMHENNGHAAEQREKSPDNSILNPWDSIHVSYACFLHVCAHMHTPLTPLFVIYAYLRKRSFVILSSKTKICFILYYLYTYTHWLDKFIISRRRQ